MILRGAVAQFLLAYYVLTEELADPDFTISHEESSLSMGSFSPHLIQPYTSVVRRLTPCHVAKDLLQPCVVLSCSNCGLQLPSDMAYTALCRWVPRTEMWSQTLYLYECCMFRVARKANGQKGKLGPLFMELKSN